MISAEVERTLVKSPPELWAELGDPVALARHLGELGEIRITKAEPEKSVEWEAQAASGKVQLKQSGWGTKVTLSVTREARGAEAESVPEPVPEQEPAPAPAPEPVPVPEQEPAPVPAPEPVPESDPMPEPEPEPPLRFFARLFKRRPRRKSKSAAAAPDAKEPSAAEVAAEQAAAAQAASEEAAAERAAAEQAAAAQAATEEAAAERAAAAEEAIAAQTTELLTTVLDRLGAAHHRPFSRT